MTFLPTCRGTTRTERIPSLLASALYWNPLSDWASRTQIVFPPSALRSTPLSRTSTGPLTRYPFDSPQAAPISSRLPRASRSRMAQAFTPMASVTQQAILSRTSAGSREALTTLATS